MMSFIILNIIEIIVSVIIRVSKDITLFLKILIVNLYNIFRILFLWLNDSIVNFL